MRSVCPQASVSRTLRTRTWVFAKNQTNALNFSWQGELSSFIDNNHYYHVIINILLLNNNYTRWRQLGIITRAGSTRGSLISDIKVLLVYPNFLVELFSRLIISHSSLYQNRIKRHAVSHLHKKKEKCKPCLFSEICGGGCDHSISSSAHDSQCSAVTQSNPVLLGGCHLIRFWEIFPKFSPAFGTGQTIASLKAQLYKSYFSYLKVLS